MVAGGLAHHHVAAEEPKAVKRASAFKIGKHGRTSRTEPNVGSLRPDQQGFMHHFSSEASEVTNLLDDSKMEELRKAEAKATALFEALINGTILLLQFVLFVTICMEPGGGRPDQPALYAAGKAVDHFAALVFFCEIVIRGVAEGPRPLHFFSGPTGSNVFDLGVAVATVVIVLEGHGAMIVVQMLRILRLMKFLNNYSATLVIVRACTGLRATGAIMTLLFMIMYVYAILGVRAFRHNDPVHFGTVQQAMLTLFVISTLNDWQTIYLVNYHGCDKMYQHEHDPTLADFYGSDSDRKFSTKLGTFYNDRCDRSEASPVTAQIYFYSFTMLTAFVVFSLFVSVIEMGMFETMEELEAEAREAAAELEDAPEFGQDHPNQWLVGCDDSTDHVQRHRAKHRTADFASITKGAGLQVDALGSDAPADAGGDARDTRDAIELYLDGPRSFEFRAALRRLYEADPDMPLDEGGGARFVIAVNAVCNSAAFQNAVTFAIIVACAVQGVDANRVAEGGATGAAIFYTEIAICVVFVAECALKILSHGARPWRYFYSSWNCFDFAVVAFTLVAYLPGMSGLPAISMLRLLRLLKLVRSYPALHVAVQSLLRAFKQVVYVGVVMALINFNLAVVGMHLFRGNDPGRFGTLAAAMVSIWGVSTLDAWDAALYTNMYGCERYGYPHGGRACNDATAYGWIAVAYFVFIVIIGALVLPTVLIGIISIAFEESTEEMRLESLANGVIDSMKARVLDWDAGPRILSEMKHLEAGYPRARRGAVILALCRFVLDHHTHWLDEKTLTMMVHALDEQHDKRYKLPQLLWILFFTAKLQIDAEEGALLETSRQSHGSKLDVSALSGLDDEAEDSKCSMLDDVVAGFMPGMSKLPSLPPSPTLPSMPPSPTLPFALPSLPEDAVPAAFGLPEDLEVDAPPQRTHAVLDEARRLGSFFCSSEPDARPLSPSLFSGVPTAPPPKMSATI
ncbi:low voltage-gated calcium channel [Aureococcus anophagefferens]|nr:low voltage-gated calcium channel [Aureococcus anophagefferens]